MLQYKFLRFMGRRRQREPPTSVAVSTVTETEIKPYPVSTTAVFRHPEYVSFRHDKNLLAACVIEDLVCTFTFTCSHRLEFLNGILV